MINQLLNNPAYYRLFKNATSLNEVAVVTADIIPNVPATLPMIISAAKPTTSPPLNTATVIDTAAPKNNGGSNLIIFIGVGLVVGIVAYNLYEYYTEKNKTIKL
jgi:hypothetical protein